MMDNWPRIEPSTDGMIWHTLVNIGVYEDDRRTVVGPRRAFTATQKWVVGICVFLCLAAAVAAAVFLEGEAAFAVVGLLIFAAAACVAMP